MTQRLWILGADDPEMQAIEGLLRECGEAVAYAFGPDGERVHPGNAYRADIGGDSTNWPSDSVGMMVYEVECAVRPYLTGATHVLIDHHRPGDPGYGLPPAEFLPASSIGQIIARLAGLGLLSWESDLGHADDQGHSYVEFFRPLDYMTPAEWRDKDIGDNAPTWIVSRHPGDDQDINYYVPRHLVFAAAADHCLAAAYSGKCPGVDPDELMQWRIETRAAHQGRTVEEVLADVEAAREILRRTLDTQRSYDQSMGTDWEHCDIADLRGQSIPELPEAAVREGVAYLATVTDRDGRVKDVLGGHTTPELVRAWMEARKTEGREVYGDPARGFAGAYL